MHKYALKGTNIEQYKDWSCVLNVKYHLVSYGIAWLRIAHTPPYSPFLSTSVPVTFSKKITALMNKLVSIIHRGTKPNQQLKLLKCKFHGVNCC